MDRRAGRLIRAAVAAATARARFSETSGALLAFATGVSVLQWAAYSILLVTQYPGASKTLFLETVAAGAIALWTTILLLSLPAASRRNTPDRFFNGTLNRRKLMQRWRRALLLRRPITLIPLAFSFSFLIVGGIRQRAMPWELLLVVTASVGIAAALLLVTLSRRARRGAGAEATVGAVLLLFLSGPNFSIAGGQVVPILAGIEIGAGDPRILVLLPMAVPLLLSIEAAVAGSVAALLDRICGRGTPRPFLTIFRHAFKFGYWLILAAVIAVLHSASGQVATLVGLAAAFGILLWVSVATARVRRIRQRWQLPSPSLHRPIVATALLSATVHAALAFVVCAVVG